MTFLEAALDILRREGRPLHYKDLAEKAIGKKLLTFVGRTPEVTMQTQLTAAVKKAPGNPFVRVKPGIFGLLRYPELTAEERAAEEKAQARGKDKDRGDKPEKGERGERSERGEKAADKDAAAGDKGEAGRRRRRRRGGRGRGRDEAAAAPNGTHAGEAGTGARAEADDDDDEPTVGGGLSAEARSAALAETGVLEAHGDDDDEVSADQEREQDDEGPTGRAQDHDDAQDGDGQGDADDDAEAPSERSRSASGAGRAAPAGGGAAADLEARDADGDDDGDDDEEGEEGGEGGAPGEGFGAVAGEGQAGAGPRGPGGPGDELGGRRRRRRRRRRRGEGGEYSESPARAASGVGGTGSGGGGSGGSGLGDEGGLGGEAGSGGSMSGGGAGDEARGGEGRPESAGPSGDGAPGENGDSQGPRRIMTPVDAALEILRGQAPGRGMHVRQIAETAARRRLVHGEASEAWRVMRTALAAEPRERLRAGTRPRVRSAGAGLFALARRPPDGELERAEHVFGEARRALRERTVVALERRIADLPAPAFEALARVMLQREGFGPATFVKRVEGTIYVEALRGRGSRPSRCLIALRPGPSSPGRRAIGELRAGIEARQQDEGVLMLAGRLGEDAISAWKQAGPPIEIADGQALAETCLRNGVGVINATISVDFVDADFFADLAEG